MGANALPIVQIGASASPISILDASPSVGTPDYTNETDSNYQIFSLAIISQHSDEFYN
jgi:hypothetical protein